MLSPARLRDLASTYVLLWLAIGPISTAAASRSSAKSAHHDTAPEVCVSKTINYITHTLPQQCLRTAWSAANTTSTTPPASTSSHDGQATSTQQATVNITTDVSASPSAQATQAAETQTQPASTEAQPSAKPIEDDGDDLATGNFMSFEEWKAMMLKKSGQDPADLKARKSHGDGSRGTDHGGLDSWGDDAEIALDFDVLNDKISGFTATVSAAGSASTASTAGTDRTEETRQDPVIYDDGVSNVPRPKDAGKTCKERFSFSSFDGGATVLKASPGVKNSKAILVETKDSYMLFTCSQKNKFVIVELSEDILVDTVVLGTFEFFSSMVRTFRVSVSDRYPVKGDKWKDLGTFQAMNTRAIQPFLIEDPKIWAKYIRIEFLTHYGREYYCPVSLLRVHGTRMLDSWKDAEGGQDDDEVLDDSSEIVVIAESPSVEQSIASSGATATDTEQTTTISEPIPEFTSQPEAEAVVYSARKETGMCPWEPIPILFVALQTCELQPPALANITQTITITSGSESRLPVQGHPKIAEMTYSATSTAGSIPTKLNESQAETASQSSSTPTSSADSVPDTSSTQAAPASPTPTSTPSHTINTTSATPSSASSNSTTIMTPRSSSSASSRPDTPPSSKIPHPKPHKPSNHTSSVPPASTASGSPSPPPHPSHHVQSPDFFRSVSKRLSLLESNTTLSLQYIEDQSRFLREALAKMERRQFSRVDNFLDSLNNTVLGELRTVRQQYDQIWQSTVLALESQRETSAREILALFSRVGLLADEVVFQKRMAILQSVLLLGCLALVVFGRSSGALGFAAAASNFGPAVTSPTGSTIIAGNGGDGSSLWSPPPWRRGSRYWGGGRSGSTVIASREYSDAPLSMHAHLDGADSPGQSPLLERASTSPNLPLTPQRAERQHRARMRRFRSQDDDPYSDGPILPSTPLPDRSYKLADHQDDEGRMLSEGSDTTEIASPMNPTSTGLGLHDTVDGYAPDAYPHTTGEVDGRGRESSVAFSVADTIVAGDDQQHKPSTLPDSSRKPLPSLPEDPT